MIAPPRGHKRKVRGENVARLIYYSSGFLDHTFLPEGAQVLQLDFTNLGADLNHLIKTVPLIYRQSIKPASEKVERLSIKE